MQTGAQRGNRNAVKNRPWTDAIRRALARANGTVAKALDSIADDLVAKAKANDAWARDEIANRLEGKPAQSLDITGDMTTRTANQVSDDDLADIATGSGTRATDAPEGTQEPPGLH